MVNLKISTNIVKPDLFLTYIQVTIAMALNIRTLVDNVYIYSKKTNKQNNDIQPTEKQNLRKPTDLPRWPYP